ncbi:magnesium/cobalt transporter CorA [Candidatus Latescibacterota bacterium]
MITIYSYNIAEGTLEQPSVDRLPELFETENVDLWVDLETPAAEESQILSSVFHFHELAIEDCTAVDIEEAKLDDYESYLFLVLHSVFFSRDRFRFDITELDLFFGKNYVVTYHKKPTAGIGQLKKRLEKDIDFMGHGTDEILHAIVDQLVDNYMVSFKQLERSILHLEAEILSDPSEKTFNNIFRLKRGLVNLKRIITPEEEVIDSLGSAEHELIQEENKVYFQDIHDHVSTIRGLLNSYLEMVTGTMDSYVSVTTHRMNRIIQTLTVIATIVLIPTLIASIYGMNFDKMPLLHNSNGFVIVTALCFMLAGIMLWYFKKHDWF